MFTTISRRLITYYLAVIAVIVILIGAFFIWFLNYFYMENLRESLFSQATFTASLVEEMLDREASPAEIDTLFKELGSKLGVRITLVDPGGTVLADSDEDPARMDNHSDRPEIIEAYRKPKGEASRYSATLDEEMYYLAVPLGREPALNGDNSAVSVLRLALPLAAINRAITGLFFFILGALLISSLLAMGAALVLSRKITGPIGEINRAAREIAAGNFKPSLNVGGRDELALLADNITEMGRSLKEKMEQVLGQKNKLETVVASMSSGIILTNSELKVEMINPTAERLFDLKRNQVAGEPLQNLVRYHSLDENLKAARLDGRPRMMELSTYYPRSAALETYILPVKGSDQEVIGVLLLFHEVTHLRSIEKMRSDFVANVSHEMRTPLTALRGYTETILHEELTRDQLFDFLAVIDQETKRLSGLVDDLLDLSRIENEKDFMKKETVDLDQLIGEALRRVEEPRSGRKVRIEVDNPAEKLIVTGNREWLCRALVNILENSIRHGRPGGRINVAVIPVDGSVTVKIEDDGPGIPEADLPYVFERFYRVDKARSRKSGGTGLGLSIVKHIMEAHAAAYSLESIEGTGSIFRFTLPLASQ